MRGLKDKVAIVSGGATLIGAAVARAFVAEGAKVVVADIDIRGGTALVAELGETARFVATDVSRDADIDACVQATVKAFGHIDCLINVAAVKHAWQANRHDGIAAVVTFLATLGFAPHLDNGILVGAGLAIGLYLYRTMSPRVAILGRYHDGTLRDAKVNNLPASDVVTAVRFDGRLYFANVSYFEDAILEAVASNPKAPFLLIVADGVNEMDASGEEVVHHIVDRLRGNGVTVVFSGLKKQVIDVMRATGLFDVVTQANIFPTADQALAAIYERAGHVEADALRPDGPPVAG